MACVIPYEYNFIYSYGEKSTSIYSYFRMNYIYRPMSPLKSSTFVGFGTFVKFHYSFKHGVRCSLQPRADCGVSESSEPEEVCLTTHETSCWSNLVVEKKEITVPICSVVWEELCRAAAASEGYALRKVRTFLNISIQLFFFL